MRVNNIEIEVERETDSYAPLLMSSFIVLFIFLSLSLPFTVDVRHGLCYLFSLCCAYVRWQ